jgi:hypothetical protein
MIRRGKEPSGAAPGGVRGRPRHVDEPCSTACCYIRGHPRPPDQATGSNCPRPQKAGRTHALDNAIGDRSGNNRRRRRGRKTTRTHLPPLAVRARQSCTPHPCVPTWTAQSVSPERVCGCRSAQSPRPRAHTAIGHGGRHVIDWKKFYTLRRRGARMITRHSIRTPPYPVTRRHASHPRTPPGHTHTPANAGARARAR